MKPHGDAPRSPVAPVSPGLLVMAGILTTQLGSTVAFGLFDALGPSGTVVLRLAFAALIVTAIARPRLAGLTRDDLKAVIAFGAALAFMNVCFYQALARLPLGVAVSVEFCGPLAVAALAARGTKEIASAGLAVAGLALLAPWDRFGAALEGELSGFLFAMGAGLGWAGYIVLGARASRRVAGLKGLALAMVAGTILSLPFGAAEASRAFGSPELLLVALGVALLSSVLPYGFEYTAMRRLSARSLSLILCLEPAVATLIGLALLGDRLGPLGWAGVALVSTAGLGAAFAAPRAGSKKAP